MEKQSLILTLTFLLLGGGLKVWQRTQVSLGPTALAQDLATDSLPGIPFSEVAGSEGPDSGAVPETTGSDSGRAMLPDTSRKAEGGIRKVRGAKGKKENRSPGEKVDLNLATSEDLAGIPGIGPKTAAAIIGFRKANGPFSEAEDLLAVEGIGAKKLARIAPYLTQAMRSGEEPSAGKRLSK